MNIIKRHSLWVIVALIIASCNAEGDHPGYEYAPQMYHSTAYEPLKQIKDKEKGIYINSTNEDIGEFYTSNPYNPNEMNMRIPPANTVRRDNGYLPYRIPKDSIEYAARIMKNPLPETEAILADGQILFDRFCDHCHGAQGAGGESGLVGAVYQGVPSYTSAAIKDKSEGHIFHVITHGKGRMGSHGSQLSMEERWKVVRYVQVLQKQ